MKQAARRAGKMLGLVVGLAGCASPTAQQPPAAVPTGRYEGTLTYRGAELPVVLNLTHDTVGRTVQLLLRAPAAPPYTRWFDSVAYQAPALTARMPGGVRLALREEPNFLTGSVWLNDTLRAELVAVRRGAPESPRYALTRQPGTATQPPSLSLVPLDTAQRRPALLLWPAAAAVGAAYGWADWLAGQGAVVLLAMPSAQADSAAAPLLATLRKLRDYGAAGVDSGRVSVWATGPGAREALRAVAAGAQPAGLILQGTSFTAADLAWLRPRRRGPWRPVLGLYGGRDTTFDVAASSQLLRLALKGRPHSGVQVYEDADAGLLRRAQTDSVRRWPLPPAELPASLWQWLNGLQRSR